MVLKSLAALQITAVHISILNMLICYKNHSFEVILGAQITALQFTDPHVYIFYDVTTCKLQLYNNSVFKVFKIYQS